MKTICMITQTSYPQDPRPRKQAEYLASMGYSIDIICRARNQDDVKVENFDKITAYRVLKYGGKEKALNYLVESLLFFTMAFFKLQLLNFKRKYDLIQIHNMPNYHIFTALFQKIFKVPLILDLHDLTVELLEVKWPGKKHVFIKSLDKFVEKISCRFADALITVSEGCKVRLIERGNPEKKITLVLNSANQNIFKFDESRRFEQINENAKVFYHGTVAEHFGIHFAIEAMAKVIKKIPNSKLIIYGRQYPSYKAKLENQIKRMKLDDAIFLFDRIRLEDCYLKIKEADIGVVPYVNNDYENIGLSNKTFEYTASGLPVVASRLFSLSAIFDESCIQFAEPENPDDFADKIIELCQNPELRRVKALNARKALTEISGEVMDERYFSLINQLTTKE